MLRELHAELGIPEDYARDGARPAYAEAVDLVAAGVDMLGREQRLQREAAAAWRILLAAALADGITLLLVSGYRSFDYQASLIRKKINAGQGLAKILAVNAAPGYSEHHSGRAVDIATPGSQPLTEQFEDSEAFVWLTENASKYDFSMSYPRNNPEGFVYEPWHWAKSAD